MVCFVIVGCNACGSCTSNIPQRKKWPVPLCLEALLPEDIDASAALKMRSPKSQDDEYVYEGLSMVHSIGHWISNMVAPDAKPNVKIGVDCAIAVFTHGNTMAICRKDLCVKTLWWIMTTHRLVVQ